jgi:hypothetical protein
MFSGSLIRRKQKDKHRQGVLPTPSRKKSVRAGHGILFKAFEMEEWRREAVNRSHGKKRT